MKKYLMLLFIGASLNAVKAQENRDAVRYSQSDITGTARFRAMSGAFGALGGDLSSISLNPASSSVFNFNQIGFSINNISSKHNSNYFGNKTTDRTNDLNLNQAGGVFVFKNENKKDGWNKFSLGINYENLNNLNNKTFVSGTNPTNSIDEYFLYYANNIGIPLGVILDNNYFQLNHLEQQAFLGYEGYLINAKNKNDDNNIDYTTNVPFGGNYFHESSVTSTGNNGKLSFNASASFKNKIYIGLNLNSHFIDFRQNSTFYEENNNAANSYDIDLIDTYFENEIQSTGTGFSFQLGTIIKATKELRLGFTYESPTWLSLNDKTRQNLISTINKDKTNPLFEKINPDSNEFITDDIYQLKTPSKFTGGFAYTFNKKGLISIDYSIKDYGSNSYTSDTYIRNPFVNADIKKALDYSSEVRIGGEYKIQAFSLRGGYRFEESPYKNKTIMGDLNSFSGGIGYDFGGTKLDLSYAKSYRSAQQGFFDQGFTDGAKINTTNSSFTISLLFEL